MSDDLFNEYLSSVYQLYVIAFEMFASVTPSYTYSIKLSDMYSHFLTECTVNMIKHVESGVENE